MISAPPRVLLLTGSPRIGKSNSESLGLYLLDRLAEKGWQTHHFSLLAREDFETLLQHILDEFALADLIVFSGPLYVDSLPAAVIPFLQKIAEFQSRSPGENPKQFTAILNCGFQEAFHNDVAMEILRLFALRANLHWCGGLAMGAGELIDQKSLPKSSRLCRHARSSLDLAAEALDQKQDIPAEAIRLIAKAPIPRWMYVFVANLWWLGKAFQNRVLLRLRSRPDKE